MRMALPYAESLQSYACTDHPCGRLETPLPVPQNSETPPASGSRWRWMEKRWLVLFATVLVSIFSMAIVRDPRANWISVSFIHLIEGGFTQLGLVPPGFLEIVPLRCAWIWFLPFALRLGWLRAAVWIGLIGISTALAHVMRQWSYSWDALILLLPCVAMIGRRTRPWIAFPAVAFCFALIIILNNMPGYQYYAWTYFHMSPYFFRHVVAPLP